MADLRHKFIKPFLLLLFFKTSSLLRFFFFRKRVFPTQIDSISTTGHNCHIASSSLLKIDARDLFGAKNNTRFSSWGALICNRYEARTSGCAQKLTVKRPLISHPQNLQESRRVLYLSYILQVGYTCSIFTCLDSGLI